MLATTVTIMTLKTIITPTKSYPQGTFSTTDQQVRENHCKTPRKPPKKAGKVQNLLGEVQKMRRSQQSHRPADNTGCGDNV